MRKSTLLMTSLTAVSKDLGSSSGGAPVRPSPGHVLVIRTSAFGDVVHTFYVLSDLRRALPDTRISWCVDERFADLARLHPAVTHVIALPTRRWRHLLTRPTLLIEIIRWVRALRGLAIDVSLDLQGLYKSALVGFVSGAPLRLGPETVSERGVQRLYHRQVHGQQVEGLAQRTRSFAGAALGYDALSYRMCSGVDSWRRSDHTGRIRIVMMVGASRPDKLWPATQWVALCHALLEHHDPSIELLWGMPAEQDVAKNIASQIQDGRVTVAQKVYSVQELRERFLGANVVIGGDTGLTHFAAALGVPTVMLFLKTHAIRYTHPDLENLLFVDHIDGPVLADRVIAKVKSALLTGNS